jgi:hypothetical protein
MSGSFPLVVCRSKLGTARADGQQVLLLEPRATIPAVPFVVDAVKCGVKLVLAALARGLGAAGDRQAVEGLEVRGVYLAIERNASVLVVDDPHLASAWRRGAGYGEPPLLFANAPGSWIVEEERHRSRRGR